MWVALGATCLAVALAVWGLDLAAVGAPPGVSRAGDFAEHLYSAVGITTQARDADTATSVGGNVLALVFSFLALVIVALFTANTCEELDGGVRAVPRSYIM